MRVVAVGLAEIGLLAFVMMINGLSNGELIAFLGLPLGSVALVAAPLVWKEASRV